MCMPAALVTLPLLSAVPVVHNKTKNSRTKKKTLQTIVSTSTTFNLTDKPISFSDQLLHL